eukprot:m51a1_g9737 putative transforming growth factor beta-1-induced transcript 1 protein (289) ;mRNA; r:1536500-1537871
MSAPAVPTCVSCGQPLLSDGLTVLGKAYHREHLCCGLCGCALAVPALRKMYDVGAEAPCCAECYETRLPRCRGCGEALLPSQPRISAAGALWHADHFRCRACGEDVSAAYWERAGDVYCKRCLARELLREREAAAAEAAARARVSAVVCDACHTGVLAGQAYRRAADKAWHEDCFVCNDCMAPLPDKFHYHDGVLLCPEHYAQRTGRVCGGCGKAIGTGEYMRAVGKMWHKEHFKCACCGVALGDKFFEKDGKPQCDYCNNGDYLKNLEQMADRMLAESEDQLRRTSV